MDITTKCFKKHRKKDSLHLQDYLMEKDCWLGQGLFPFRLNVHSSQGGQNSHLKKHTPT